MKELYISEDEHELALYAVYDTKWTEKKHGFWANDLGYAHKFGIHHNYFYIVRNMEINYDALQNPDIYNRISTTKAIQLIFEFEAER